MTDNFWQTIIHVWFERSSWFKIC